MAELLQFENVRSPWHRCVLRASGLPQPLSWRALPNAERTSLGGIRSLAQVVCVRDATARVVRFIKGATPERARRELVVSGLLDCALLEQRYAEVAEVRSLALWIAFDDGGVIEVEVLDRAVLGAILRRARAVMTREKRTDADTLQLAASMNAISRERLRVRYS